MDVDDADLAANHQDRCLMMTQEATIRLPSRVRILLGVAGGLVALTMSGCHKQQQRMAYQPPPSIFKPNPGKPSPPPASRTAAAKPSPVVVAPPPSVDLHAESSKAPHGFFDDTSGKPIFTETGMASWYGTGFQHHAAADGTTFDQNAMTAAHRTLPMGSTVRVTNLTTGQQVLVRITDRGPFSGGRILDLSMGAAKAIGLYRMGVAKVKIEAFPHPAADPGGKWCVQAGTFKTEGDAIAMKAKLLKRYQTAKVIEFSGPTGYWVRIDPPLKTKTQANEVADFIGSPQASVVPYVVRLN
jgi:rare lipoprotein A